MTYSPANSATFANAYTVTFKQRVLSLLAQNYHSVRVNLSTGLDGSMNNNSSSELSTVKSIVACSLPFLIILVFYGILEPENARASFIEMLQQLSLRRAAGWTRLSRHCSTFGSFSLPKAIISYDQYLEISLENVEAMRHSYSRPSWSHKYIGYWLRFGIPGKVET